MLPLLAAAIVFAAAPAPAPAAKADPKPAAKAEPKAETKTEAKSADDAHGPHEGHHHGQQEEKPLDETGKKVVALSDAMVDLTRQNVTAYNEMVALARDSKDCAATAKDTSARLKKLDADLAARRTKLEELKKGLDSRLQQETAGLALIKLKDELAKARAGFEEDGKVVLSYRGKCPKQADEVDKAIASVRKRVAP